MKRSEAAEIVMLLVGAYNRDVTEQTARVYEAMLVDLDAKTCRAAVQRLIGTSRFLPTVAEIRDAATSQSLGRARTGEEAYAELTAAVRVHGRDYGQGIPKFRDPLIARCIGVWGSWNDLCSSPSDDPGGRARFIELYDQLAQAERQDQVSGVPLPAPANDRPAFWLPSRVPTRPLLEAAKQETNAGVTRPSSRATPVTSGPPSDDHEESATTSPGTPAADIQPRRWTAEEIDRAINAPSAAHGR